MSGIRKYLDWRGWLAGLYFGVVPKAIDKLLDFLTTNGVEAAGLSGVGLTWQQVTTTFASSLLVNALLYVRSQPAPNLVEEVRAKAP
jgi:hypothetical protein